MEHTEPSEPFASVPEEDTCFVLKRPAFYTPPFVVMLVVGGTFALSGLAEVVQVLLNKGGWQESKQAVWVSVFWGVMLAGIVLRRWFMLRASLAPFQCGALSFRAPKAVDEKGVLEVPYEQIQSFSLYRYGGETHLAIETKQWRFHFGAASFEQPSGPERVALELRRRILMLPQGPLWMAAMDTRRIYAEKVAHKKPLVTHALLGVCAVFFVNEYLLDAFKVPYFGVLPWGANVPWDVLHGEYFRVAASTFVFGRPLQAVMHVMALVQVAPSFERVAGGLRMLGIFLLTALCGNCVDAVWGHTVVGTGLASGVWGLLAAYATLHVRFKANRPVGLWRPTRWWVFTGLLAALLPSLWPLTLDVYGPLAAAGVGVVCGFLIRYRTLLVRPVWYLEGVWTAVCVLCVAVYAASLGWAVKSAAHPVEGPSADFGQRVLQAKGLDARVLSALSWVLVTDPESTTEQLESGLLLAEKGLVLQPKEPEAMDVLATAYYRLNRFEEAIKQEHTALNAEPLSYYATQLGRFVRAQLQLGGAHVDVEGLGLQDVVLRLEPDTQHTWKAVLRLSEKARKMAVRKGLVAVGVLAEGERSLGVVRVVLHGADVALVSTQVLDEVEWTERAGEVPSLRLGVVMLKEVDVPAPASSVLWQFWPPDVTVDMLP